MADGNITVEVSTQAAQAELERLRAENARLAREAHTWWTALAGATAEIEQWRRIDITLQPDPRDVRMWRAYREGAPWMRAGLERIWRAVQAELPPVIGRRHWGC